MALLYSLTEHFSPSINAICSSQFWRSSWTGLKQKVFNLNFTPPPQMPTTFQIFRNQSNRSPEPPRKPNQTLLQLGNKTNKIYFQNTRTPDSDWSRTNHIGRKNGTTTIMKSLWKLTLVLWVQDNFAGLATALNTHESHTTCSIHPHPPRPQVPSKNRH